jgi:hypothetical protein
MPAISVRRAPWPAAALAAGLGLLLSACGGSSASSTSSAGPSGAAASRPAAASSTPSPRGSGPGQLLTGNFCADLNHLGQVAGLTARQARQLKHDRHAAVSYLEQAAADFAALGREGGPQTARFMTVLAGQYQGLAAATAHGGSLVKVEREAPGLTSRGADGAAFRGLATYMQKHCS